MGKEKRQSGQSIAPPDRHCSVSGALPRHPTVRVRSRVDRWGFVLLRHRTVRCPSDSLLWLLPRYCATLFIRQNWPLRVVSRCSAGSPDSPVAHQIVRWIIAEHAFVFPRVAGWHLYGPGAPEIVRCANTQHTQVLCSVSNLVHNLNLLLVCVEPYAPVIHKF
jgi:hypothetical protein